MAMCSRYRERRERSAYGQRLEKPKTCGGTYCVAELGARLVDTEVLELCACSGASCSGSVCTQSPRRFVLDGWRWVGEGSSGETEGDEEALHDRRIG
jgi:hypothetical protein